jgi:nucleoid-associated protein YgaU
MKRANLIILVIWALFFSGGCAKKTVVPDVDVSRLDAERSIAIAQSEIDEAEKAGANVKDPKIMLEHARELLSRGNYARAKIEADNAAKIARLLKEKILSGARDKEDAKAAIDRADRIIKETESLGGDVSEPQSILSSARAEFSGENYAQAIILADEAYDIAKEILDLLKMDKYLVGTWEADRDCLWNIAGKKGIYDDSWKWKRIYMANRDKIRDPDLIYPRQVLKIPRN